MDGGTITNFRVRQITLLLLLLRAEKWTEENGRTSCKSNKSWFPVHAAIHLHCYGTPRFRPRSLKHRNDCWGNHMWKLECLPLMTCLAHTASTLDSG